MTPSERRTPGLPGLATMIVVGVAGLVGLVLGWRMVARSLLPPVQVPALVSGGLIGLALIGAAVALVDIQTDRRGAGVAVSERHAAHWRHWWCRNRPHVFDLRRRIDCNRCVIDGRHADGAGGYGTERRHRVGQWRARGRLPRHRLVPVDARVVRSTAEGQLFGARSRGVHRDGRTGAAGHSSV